MSFLAKTFGKYLTRFLNNKNISKFLKKLRKIIKIDLDIENPNKIFSACVKLTLEAPKIDLSLGRREKNTQKYFNPCLTSFENFAR